MAYIPLAQRMSQSIATKARGTVQRPASPMADSVAQFGNQRITKGQDTAADMGRDQVPGAEQSPGFEEAPDPTSDRPGNLPSPVTAARQVTAGMSTADRSAGFNQRLTQLAQEKTRREQAQRTAQNKTGGEGSVAGRPTGPVGAGRSGVINLASTYLGSRYVLGGNNYSGIDCSGLVQQVYGKFGFNLPRLANAQAAVAGMRTSVNNLRPGDLVGWADGSHIAIYAGGGMIIQAANPAQGVIRSPLSQQTNQNYFGVALRFPGD
jgi:cell wall-associated NlpC family hydrolase